VSTVTRFDTPGSLRDLPAGHTFYDDWHGKVAGLISSVTPGKPRGEFFDPSEWDLDVAAQRGLTWMGFPRAWMTVRSRDDRGVAFKRCEDRTVQAEYLEWHVTRRGDGKITKVVLVTETPEYWETLAAADPPTVVELYKSLVDTAATEADIFSGPGGTYKRDNVWNSERGIVHYIQGINTLEDAVDLAQESVDTGAALDNFEVLSSPLESETSADPRVALDVGALARRGLSITLGDPIGLYMTRWDHTGWTKPDGHPVANYWTVRRGTIGAALRLEYEVPDSEGFVVGDVTIGGRPIDFGGQIAEHVTVMVRGLAGQQRR
jgi:hypothetical protein